MKGSLNGRGITIEGAKECVKIGESEDVLYRAGTT